MKKYIFRMDKTQPDDGAENAILEAHDGMECFAELPERYGVLDGVDVTFVDGYVNYAFVYELEEVGGE
jgi:hypothetical protein